MSESNQPPKRSKHTFIISFLIIVIVSTLAFQYRDLFVVARVNGEFISRVRLVQELEDQAAKDTLESLITETLLFQEAAAKSIVVSDADVEAEKESIRVSFEEQGQDLDGYLETQNISVAAFERQVKLQLILEQLLAERVSVTEDDVTDYVTQNEEFFVDEDTSSEDFRNEIKEQLEAQKSSTEVQILLQELNDSAEITYFKTY